MSTKKQDQPGSKEFIAMFGNVGARWFLEGKSFQDATIEFIRQLEAEQTALEARVAELKDQLAAMPGGNDPQAGELRGAATLFARAKDRTPIN